MKCYQVGQVRHGRALLYQSQMKLCWLKCCSVFLSGSRALTGAIDITGDTYNDIGTMFEKQVITIYIQGPEEIPQI